MHSLLKTALDILIVHRIETIFFVVPLAAWGPLLGMMGGTGSGALLAVAMVLNIGTAYNGLLGNSYCDYQLDKEAGSKRTMTGAMDGIGRRNVLTLFVLEIVALTALFYWYRPQYASPYADLWFWGGMLGRYVYNFPPFRFKERGVLNMLTYALNFGAMPFLLAWSLFHREYPLGIWLVVASGVLLMAAQALWGAAVDYQNDRRSNAETVAVALGLRRSLRLSQFLMIVSIPVMLFGVYEIALLSGAVGAGALRWGLILIGAGLLYSVLDRIRYVDLSQNDAEVQVRLDKKFRQLGWLVAQTTSGLVGILIIVASMPR